MATYRLNFAHKFYIMNFIVYNLLYLNWNFYLKTSPKIKVVIILLFYNWHSFKKKNCELFSINYLFQSQNHVNNTTLNFSCMLEKKLKVYIFQKCKKKLLKNESNG